MANLKIIDPGYSDPTSPFTVRGDDAVTDFVVHHSAGPLNQTPLEIDAFERENGDIYMPYTWLIDNKGNIYSGRPVYAVSAATFGRNQESVAVCLIGNFERSSPGYNGPPSQEALASLETLCMWAHRQYPSIVRTYCHGDVAGLFYGGDSNYATLCCGDILRTQVAGIKARIAAALIKH